MRISANPAIQQLMNSAGMGAPTALPGVGLDRDFGSMLMDVLQEVNQTQKDASQMEDDLITNRRPVEYHDLMIAVEKASTSMQLTLAVRNKLLEAYQEINRMQV